MDKRCVYIAADAHPGFSKIAFLSHNGALISCKDYPTSAPELINAINSVKGYKKMVVEESQVADWFKRTLEPYVDEMIVADPKKNAWIAKAEHMDDKIAALRLAELLRGGYIKHVYHPDSRRQQFKELVLHYHDITRQVTRFKNKLKGRFICRAVTVKGQYIYSDEHFSDYCRRLEDPCLRLQAHNYFTMIKHLEKLKAVTLKRIRSLYRYYPEIRQLSCIPGIGQVRAFTISAFIDTPHRFSNKRKLWAYCGLSKAEKRSNGTVYFSKSSTQGNRLLKCVFLQAAIDAASSKKDCRFKRTAERLEANNVSSKNIRRTVARQIASTVLALWKSGQPYIAVEAS